MNIINPIMKHVDIVPHTGGLVSSGHLLMLTEMYAVLMLEDGKQEIICLTDMRMSLSNKGKVIVHGKIAPVVGRVCMDQTIIDVSKIPNVKIGDEVILIGEQKGKKISVEEVASLAGTIPYEITCMIGKNAKRIYKK